MIHSKNFRPTPCVFQVLFASAILLLVTACSSTSGIDTSKPIDPAEVMRLVEKRNREIVALEGYGRISIDSPEFSGSGSINVKLLKPDSLQLDITAAFGVTIARGLLTSTTFQFYDGSNNTVVEGQSTAHNLRRLLRVGLEFGDILDVLSGTIRLPEHTASPAPEGVLQGDMYILTWSDEHGSMEYSIDPRYTAVRRLIRRDSFGDITEEVNFRDYRRKGSVFLPQIVSITKPSYDESLTVVYNNQAINELPMKFSFSFPKSARRIHL